MPFNSFNSVRTTSLVLVAACGDTTAMANLLARAEVAVKDLPQRKGLKLVAGPASKSVKLDPYLECHILSNKAITDCHQDKPGESGYLNAAAQLRSDALLLVDNPAKEDETLALVNVLDRGKWNRRILISVTGQAPTVGARAGWETVVLPSAADLVPFLERLGADLLAPMEAELVNHAAKPAPNLILREEDL